jgi:flavin-dependent dehydrogenase
MLSRKLGIRKGDPKLRKAAIFAHYKNCVRDPGKNGGATLVLSTKQNDGWFWYIPLPDDITSVGVVGRPVAAVEQALHAGTDVGGGDRQLRRSSSRG